MPRRPAPVDQLPLTVPVFQILLALVDRDQHGYALIRDIHERTEGEVRLTASTLYGALARLLDGGFVDEIPPGAGHGRRRCYRLTRSGRALVRLEAERLARSTGWAREKRLLTRASSAGS
jgi:DNA-binding PadR family transcriptional regulator